MEKSEIRIFIIEDDATLAKALSEMIKRSGYTPVVCSNPTDAISQFRIQGAQVLIIDCLLPKMSGIDLAMKFRQEGATKLPIILTSGVFKDKGFIKETTQKTGAVAFLSKPFNVNDLLKIIHDSVVEIIDEEISPLEQFLLSSLTPGEKIANINKIDSIHGFDIPWVCSMLMNQSVSGILKLSSHQTPATISFTEGKIVQVEMENRESYFGNLLIENGYVTPEQLQDALKNLSQKRIGEKLVELNYLSPHVIDMTNAEQMAIRLSKIIIDNTYMISFEEKSIAISSSYLDTESVAPFLVDWIHSKITFSWLKQRYLKWIDCACIRTSSTSKLHKIWTFPLLKSRPALVAEFEKGSSLGQILSKQQYPEQHVYQVFHLLIMIEHIKLKKEIRKMADTSAQTSRLKKIWSDMQTQDYFAVLGVPRNSKAGDIKKTYHELAKIFHPDKVPDQAPSELKDLTKNVFGMMTKAYETLSNETKRATHIKEIDMGRAEKVLQAEALLEEGKALLASGQAVKSLEKFHASEDLKPPSSDLLIHMAWAILLSSEQGASGVGSEEGEEILSKIPPEDRHNASYYFVKGFLQKLKGDYVAAKKNILHSLSLKPKFIEAERLLRFLDAQKSSKSVDLLHGNLTDIVGAFFKKS